MHHATLRRALEGGASARTLAAIEKIKDRLRTADEFKGKAAQQAVRAPRRAQAVYAWNLEAIRRARDAQMQGDFALPCALAAAMRTDFALFSAYHNRIAPHTALATELKAASGARGKAVRKRALTSCMVPRPVLQGIVGTLADHGVAIGHIVRETNREGTRTDFQLEEWPLEFVRWSSHRRVLETTIDGGSRADIVHGDGEWIIFRKFAAEPWKQEACALPGAMIWAGHANALKDWAGSSSSHGNAKVVGTLPEGWTLRDAAGNLTPEAQAFLDLLRDIISGESGAGLKPFGSELEVLANNSTMWQVFKEFGADLEKAAARIYLGTDAMMGSQGGAPGIDIAALFGVATTKIQGDVQAIEDGLNTGLYDVWCAENEGDSRYAPRFAYVMPDPDAAQAAEQIAKRREAFFAALEGYRKNGFEVTQEGVNELAKEYRIPAPRLKPPAAPIAAAYDETKHDRDDGGKFSGRPGGGGGGGDSNAPKDRPASDNDSTPDLQDKYDVAVDRRDAAKQSAADAARAHDQAAAALSEAESERVSRKEINAKKREAARAERKFERDDAKHFDAFAEEHEAEFFADVPRDAKSQVAAQERMLSAYNSTPEAIARREAFQAKQSALEAEIDRAEEIEDRIPDLQRAKDLAANKQERAERAVSVHEREVARRKRDLDADGDGRTGDEEELDDDE